MLQVVVGGAGFYFHPVADISGLSSSLSENFIHGAPVFALLLCANIALAAIGLWDMRSQGAPADSALSLNPVRSTQIHPGWLSGIGRRSNIWQRLPPLDSCRWRRYLSVTPAFRWPD